MRIFLPLWRHRRYGPTWTGSDMMENFSDTKDYLGIIFPIALAAVGNSLMALVSAKTAGAHPIPTPLRPDWLILPKFYKSPTRFLAS